MNEAVATPPAGFVTTDEYVRFTEFLDNCRRYRYIGVCVGAPGVGKTLSARRYTQWDLLEPQFPRYAYSKKPPRDVATCRSMFYTPPVANSPAVIANEIERRRALVSWLVDAAMRSGPGRIAPADIVDRTELVIVDEANRLKVTALEQLRDLYDRDTFGFVLLGMPGLEKSLARYPQLYSRVGFVHRFHALGSDETRTVITEHAHVLGIGLPAAAFADAAAVAAIVRMSGGNFRLIQRLLQQVERVLEINALTTVTPDVVDAARELLVIGAT